MEKLTVYYSVSDGGDGSAYPVFFADKAVAEWHQSHEEKDSWAEDCTGSITFEGDNLCCPDAETKEEYYLRLFLDGWENEDEVQKFTARFFPEGLPIFDVNIIEKKYYGILVKGKVIYKSFSHPDNASEKGRWKLEKKLKNE